MNELMIQAKQRNVFGKKNKALRRQGQVPTHLFGHNVTSQALQCDAAALKKVVQHAGTTRLVNLNIEGENESRSVFIREIQRDVLGRQLLHVDFYQIKKGEKMHTEVPVVLVGEAPALKSKGRLLTHGISELSIECFPENVPPQVEVDISVLEEVDQEIFVKDIKLGDAVTILTEPDQLVVKVSEIYVKAEAEEVAKAEEAGEETKAAGEAEAEGGSGSE